jgi:hypothetical protein
MTGLRQLPLESFPPFESVPELIRAANAATEDYTQLARDREWDQLHAHSANLVGLAEVLLRHIEALTVFEHAGADSLSKRDRWLTNAFERLAGETSTEADNLRAVMLDKLNEVTGDPAAAQAAFDQMLAGKGALFNARASTKARAVSAQDVLARSQVHLSVLHCRAAVEASMFKAQEHTKTLELSPALEGDTVIMEGEGDALRTVHDELVHSLFETLRSDAEVRTFIGLCASSEAQLALRLPVSAVLLGSYLALPEAEDAAERIRQSKAAVAVAEGIRRLSMLHAYASLMRTASARLDQGRWYSLEQQRTETRMPETKVPDGQVIELSEVNEDNVDDGAFVQVDGRVSELGIRDDPAPPKFSSFFRLTDHTSDNSVLVRAHMFSLDLIGLRNGAHVRLNSHVRIRPDWAPDDALALDLDRVALGDLRRESWYDDMTYRVRSHSMLYPSEMNMFFTPSSGE